MERTSFSVLLIIFLRVCDCFLPTPESVKNSWTHSSITRSGIFKGASTYLKTNGLVSDVGQTDISCIDGFFGADADGFEQFENIINTIIKSNNEIQKDSIGVASRSFNGENILTGHSYLVSLRSTIALEAKKQKPSFSALRQWIGEYLYTLQSFYSNTNWIELKGEIEYTDLGIGSKDIMETASVAESTCRSSSFEVSDIAAGSCRENLITAKLTSGYRSGHEVPKPQSSSNTKGKCSHGGKYDTSRQLVATCGINKETSQPDLSPHYHLHEDASMAAIAATASFLISQTDGLLKILGEDLFKSVFGLFSKTAEKSLTFIIDVTGSMKNDIENVRKWTINKVTSVINSKTEPLNYVLVTFSDPANLTTGVSTSNGYEMLELLRNLRAAGGGDCPEYSLSGIERATTLAAKGSNIFIFTDASAKDSNRWSEVGPLLTANELTVKIILTGNCTTRKKRSTSQTGGEYTRDMNSIFRVKRQAGNLNGSVYDYLALLTGGTVYETTSANIGTVLDALVSESFPSADVILDFQKVNTSNPNYIDIFIDKTLFTLRITVFGIDAETDVTVISPSGIPVAYFSSNDTTATRVMTDNKRVDITIQTPLTGKWRIYWNISRDLIVNITGQSSLDFTYRIMQTDNGNVYEVNGSPIQGNNYTAVISLLGTNNASVLSLICVAPDGTDLSHYTLTASSSSEDRYSTQISADWKQFYFKIEGLDDSGNDFTRVKWIPINPVSVRLYLHPLYDQLLVGRKTNIIYSINNEGESNETFWVSISNDKGYVFSPESRSHELDSGEVITGNFTIQPDHDLGAMVYTVSVSNQGKDSILQSISKGLSVTAIQHPECEVKHIEGSCQKETLTIKNCNRSVWSVITETDYSDIEIVSVSLSIHDPRIQIIHANVSALNGPLHVNVSGTCCSGSTELIILDSEGYIGRCNIDFHTNFVTVENDETVTIRTSDNQTVTVSNDVTNETITESYSNTAMIVGIAVGVPITVIVIVCVVVVIKCTRVSKIKKYMVDKVSKKMDKNACSNINERKEEQEKET